MAATGRSAGWPATRRMILTLAAIAFVAGSAWLGFLKSEQTGIAELRADSNHRLDLFSSAVQGVIKRLEYVPATIQLNHEILALLGAPGDAQRIMVGNDYLRRLNAHLGSIAVYVMNDRGIVLASSNNDKPDDSMMHTDVSFRPYFLEALSGRVGRHFAIGIHGGAPGYFVSYPVRDGAQVVGVAAIKISLEPIERIWDMLGARALLADTNQVVILSSEPAWRYTALTVLPVERRVDLQLTHMYDNRRVGVFPLHVPVSNDDDSQIVTTAPDDADPKSASSRDAGLLVLSRTLDGMDWRVTTFSSLGAVRSQSIVSGAMSAVAASFLVLLALYLAQNRRIQRQKHEAQVSLERVNAELERNVESRTVDLTTANERLRKEITERERAEQTLRDAQGELVHTAKMAILGQLATGITHELTQPLGAIRTLSGNASEFLRRGDLHALEGNLNIIARMADQMGGIIQPLKGFARKSLPVPARVDVAHAVNNALFLYESRLRNECIELVNHCAPGQVEAWCDANRLEQVLINLIGNALDAMETAPVKRLTLHAIFDEDTEGHAIPLPVRIEVLDTGAGLDDETLSRLFEPFFTTKPSGVGLGLGLVISRDIMREFGGDIEAFNRPEGGARFCLYLPMGHESFTDDH
jgi:C4-dicarboxylate-specific signal transduction histidine kinase